MNKIKSGLENDTKLKIAVVSCALQDYNAIKQHQIAGPPIL